MKELENIFISVNNQAFKTELLTKTVIEGKSLTIFGKSSSLNVCFGSVYASALVLS